VTTPRSHIDTTVTFLDSVPMKWIHILCISLTSQKQHLLPNCMPTNACNVLTFNG
jgi:hypothetical protein